MLELLEGCHESVIYTKLTGVSTEKGWLVYCFDGTGNCIGYSFSRSKCDYPNRRESSDDMMLYLRIKDPQPTIEPMVGYPEGGIRHTGRIVNTTDGHVWTVINGKVANIHPRRDGLHGIRWLVDPNRYTFLDPMEKEACDMLEVP
jgi:hypothetical protein